MRFAWLEINSSYAHSALSVAALTAQLDKRLLEQNQWSVVKGTIKANPSSLIAELEDLSPDIIFATCWLFNIDQALKVLSGYNALDNRCKIYLGGPEFLGDNSDFFFKYPFVTALFKGEGEEIFNSFITALVSGNYLPDIEGFYYNTIFRTNTLNNTIYTSISDVITDSYRNGSILDNEEGYISLFRDNIRPSSVKDFSSLAPPEESPFFDWEKPFVQLETSRGCFNSCSFCISGTENTLQYINPQIIEERIKYIESKGIKEIRILDRTFNANMPKALEMLEIFKKFYGSIRFHVEIHPAFINNSLKDYLQTLPKGLLHIEAGVQSLHQIVLEGVRRKGGASESLRGLQILKDLNISELHLDLIAGLPGYSYVELLTDIDRLIAFRPEEIQLELLKLLPGTELRVNHRDYGICYSPNPPYEVIKTNDISFRELQNVKIVSKIIDYWYNSPIWQNAFISLYNHAVRPGEEMQDSYRIIIFWEQLRIHLKEETFIEAMYSLENKGTILFDFTEKFYPSQAIEISLAWIRAGLSIKKRPAEKYLRKWNIKFAPKNNNLPLCNNPLLDRENPHLDYYYISKTNGTHWFAYNKKISRNRPVNEIFVID